MTAIASLSLLGKAVAAPPPLLGAASCAHACRNKKASEVGLADDIAICWAGVPFFEAHLENMTVPPVPHYFRRRRDLSLRSRLAHAKPFAMSRGRLRSHPLFPPSGRRLGAGTTRPMTSAPSSKHSSTAHGHPVRKQAKGPSASAQMLAANAWTRFCFR